ncbi:MAG TPA: PKD domain-containing protein, partial [Solirubrobacterales bacterium]
PVDLAAQTAGTEIALPGGGESSGGRVAITPDGKRAYVADSNTNQVVPIGVGAKPPAAGIPIDVGVGPFAIAITPDGSRAYVTNNFSDTVTPINLATNTALPPIPVGGIPFGIAITPDGARAYVANLFSGDVSVIDLATNTVIATIPIGVSPTGVAVAPDGKHVYVTEGGGDTIPIDVATNAAGPAITGAAGAAIAITPDGARAYTADDSSGASVPINLMTATAGTPIPAGESPRDIAILPDGSRAYLPSAGTPDQLAPIDLATNTALAGFPVGSGPQGIAIVPNQPPHAAFASSSPAPKPGASIAFNATGSTDPDGTVARYDWDFGDGVVAKNAGAEPSHAYAKAGAYQVTLTTTDNEGCSTALVFSGQTASCNGSDVARVAHPVTVGGNCPKVEGTASSFVPKLRSHRVVPGVRIRLAVNAPAHLDIKSTLLWAKEGESGRVDLGEINVDVTHSRRLRMAIPGALRTKLPLGTPVKVSLHIHATPRGGDACAGNVTHPTLRLHVVKVIPDAVQALRHR